jgi:hypothetical protein
MDVDATHINGLGNITYGASGTPTWKEDDGSWVEGTQLPSLTSADHSRLKWTIAFGIVIGAVLTSLAGFVTLLAIIALTQIG